MRVVYPYHSFAQHMSKTRIVGVHQTSLGNATSILYENKIYPRPGSRGCGIYACYNAPTTNHKCRGGKGTCLYMDIYLGKNTKNIDLDENSFYDSTINDKFNGDEIIVRTSDRVLNIKYLNGDKPNNIWLEMRPRMLLIFGTTRSNARSILNNQEIPMENHPNIAGKGYYLWPDVPSATKYGNSGRETFLVADVFFTNTFENRSYLPQSSDLMKYDSFRGTYNETCYFMVKYSQRIKNIRFIDGVEP